MGADEFSPITLDLTVFIEGYYIGGSTMNSVLLNSGVAGATALQCDTITVQLRNSVFPHGLEASFKGVLGTDGTLSCKFPSDKIGSSYFIALRHRSAVQTWSGLGGRANVLFGRHHELRLQHRYRPPMGATWLAWAGAFGSVLGRH
ncbi:MAG: hypothetical protein IPN76_15130 [Saprospiraceae bacterium]|nr:hypothetical protein [Saprospiraceae bacterium]